MLRLWPGARGEETDGLEVRAWSGACGLVDFRWLNYSPRPSTQDWRCLLQVSQLIDELPVDVPVSKTAPQKSLCAAGGGVRVAGRGSEAELSSLALRVA